VSSPSVSVQQGASSAVLNVSALGQNGFSGAVSLTINGLPSGVNASPSSFTYTVGTSQPVAVTFAASGSAAVGNISADIKGTATVNDATITHDSNFGLVVTAAPANDFAMATDVPTLAVGVGKSGNAQVSVTAVGQASGTMQIALAATVPAGVTVSFAPQMVSVGQTAALTLSVGSTVNALFTGSVTITGTVVGAPSTTHSLAIPLTVPVGGGSLSFVMDASLSPADATYISQLGKDISAPGYLYDTCGSATGTRVVNVIRDPKNNEFTSENVNGLTMPTISFEASPAPDTSGVDKSFDEIFVHEAAHALRDDLLALQALSAAHDIIFASDEEGFAEDCATLVLKKLAQ
jgi:hypothetical protein